MPIDACLDAAPPTPLVGHVAHVVGLRAKEQVSRIAAVANIAAMKDEKPIRDGAMCQLP